jgi:hypothetical protein
MAKRLNPRRRLLAKQAAVFNTVRKLHGAPNDADAAKLQQGVVRSNLNGLDRRAQSKAKSSREPNWTPDGDRERPAGPPLPPERKSSKPFAADGKYSKGGKFVPRVPSTKVYKGRPDPKKGDKRK